MLHIFHYYSAPVVINYISQMLFIASQSAYILKLLLLNGLSVHFCSQRFFHRLIITYLYVIIDKHVRITLTPSGLLHIIGKIIGNVI